MQSMRSIQFKHVNSFSDSNGRLLNAMGSLCAQGIYISGNHKTEREDFGRLCSNRTVQIQWLQFPVLPLNLSFDLLLPLNVSLSSSQYRARLGCQVGGIAIVFFQMGGMALIIFFFF